MNIEKFICPAFQVLWQAGLEATHLWSRDKKQVWQRWLFIIFILFISQITTIIHFEMISTLPIRPGPHPQIVAFTHRRGVVAASSGGPAATVTERRRLGKTDLEVSTIGVGAWSW
jgi:hypothetical protein